METDAGTEEFGSSTRDRIAKSYVDCKYFTQHEHKDLTRVDRMKVYTVDYDDSGWPSAVEAKAIDTDYQFTDCPADRLQDVLSPECISTTVKDGITEKVYDTGKNCSALPVLQLSGKPGEEVMVLFAEEKTGDNRLDMGYNYKQKFTIIGDGSREAVRPVFTWFAFRYFSVIGNAEPLYVQRVHSNVAVTSGFTSSSESLNWLYEAFLTTQLSNMHAGIPSDCPHDERKGYTGDGQLICHAAMDVLDGKAFYRKWIADISDCQDKKSGHIQYTAPYLRSGGGPGGWGCAIVEVPYRYYLHYGETEPLEALYGQMLEYFRYLEDHSENQLVVSDKEGEWCLGDWCPPVEVILPAPFVNNYFYIKSLEQVIEIAKILRKEEDIPGFEEKIRIRKNAIMKAYYNVWDGNFLGNVQGANAFAVDLGLGDERTYKNLVDRYEKLGCYDTGIFGTDIVTRILFERGDGETAYKLLASEKTHSFGGMRLRGATSLWEYWPQSLEERSHNHPMFGAVTAYLFDHILGIQQEEGSCGYEKQVIQPFVPKEMTFAQGYRTIPAGKVKVQWTREGENVTFIVEVPQEATFRFGGKEQYLKAGVPTKLIG